MLKQHFEVCFSQQKKCNNILTRENLDTFMTSYTKLFFTKKGLSCLDEKRKYLF